MFFKPKCEHEFVEKGNNLYCKKCGKYIRMICDNKWKIHVEKEVTLKMTGVHHSMQTLICERCGKIKFLNLTAGTCSCPSECINIKYN